MRVSSLFLFALAGIGCSSGDASTTSDVTGSDPVPGPATLSNYAMNVTANAVAERLVMGTFLDDYRPGTSCTKEEVAGCLVSVCTKTDGASAGTPVDPGKLTASSASIGTDVPVPLTGGYARLVQAGTFADDEEVRVVATGGAAIGGFDLKVKVPGKFTVTKLGSCAPGAAGTKCNLSEAAPVIEWTGAPDAIVVVGLLESADVTPHTTLSCNFAGAKGNGKIPAAALAKLPRKWPYTVAVSARGAAAVSSSGKTTAVFPSRTWSNSLTVTLPGG